MTLYQGDWGYVMSAIERIRPRLKEDPHLNYQTGNDWITIDAPSPDGFSVALYEDTSEWIVQFDGWHEHFDTEDQALNCFAFGLSHQCRLEVTLCGEFAYRWTLQSKEPTGWTPDSTTGLLFFPFWRRRRTEYRQNDVLEEGPA